VSCVHNFANIVIPLRAFRTYRSRAAFWWLLFQYVAVLAINEPEERKFTILFLDVFCAHRESDAGNPDPYFSGLLRGCLAR